MVTSASTSAAAPNTIIAPQSGVVTLGAGADVLVVDTATRWPGEFGMVTVNGFTPGEDTLVLQGFSESWDAPFDTMTLDDWEDWRDLETYQQGSVEHGSDTIVTHHFDLVETAEGLRIEARYIVDDGYIYTEGYELWVTLAGVSLDDLTEEPVDDLVGTEGPDALSSALDAVVLSGRGGDDALSATGDGVTLQGDDGDDLLHATGAGAALEGGAGEDLIYALGAGGAAWGGADDDTIHLGKFGGAAFGGAGDDRIEASFKRLGEFTVEGGAGADTFAALGMGGNAKAATLTIADFDPGEDMLEITTASGAVMGFTLDALPEGVLAEEDEDGNTILTLEGDGFDRIVLTGVTIPEPATITLTEGNDLFRTPAGAEIIDAGAGNDTILAFRGTHEIRLGAGDDVVFARHSALIEGGAGDDVMHLDMGRNADYALSGGTGADVFNLSGALDTRSASAVIADFTPGTDRLVIEGTEIGPDPLPEDIVLGEDEDGNAVVQFGDDETVTLLGIGRSDLFGSTPNGIVDGTNGADLIDDFYTDAAGEGVLDENYTEIIMADGGDDTISLRYDISSSTLVDAGAGDDRVFIQMGTALGGAGDDTLVGGANGYVLDGGAGNDVLGFSGGYTEGGQMTGGSGQDTFNLSERSMDVSRYGVNQVTVTDYTAGEDQVAIGGQVLTQDDIDNDFSDFSGKISIHAAGENTRITWREPYPPGGNDGGYYGAAEMTLSGISAEDFLASLAPAPESADLLRLDDGTEIPTVPVPEEQAAPEEEDDLLDA